MAQRILTPSLRDLDSIMICGVCISCRGSRTLRDPHEVSPGRLAGPPGGFAVREHAPEETPECTPSVAREWVTPPRWLRGQYFVDIPTFLVAHGSRAELCGRIRGADGCTRGWSSSRRRNHAEKRPAAGVVRDSASPNIHHGYILVMLYDTSSIRVYCHRVRSPKTQLGWLLL